jgi:hypothetical protein
MLYEEKIVFKIDQKVHLVGGDMISGKRTGLIKVIDDGMIDSYTNIWTVVYDIDTSYLSLVSYLDKDTVFARYWGYLVPCGVCETCQYRFGCYTDEY